jgi:hypothetical protein
MYSQYTTNPVNKTLSNISSIEPYSALGLTDNINPDIWLSKYFDAIHVYAQTYYPQDDATIMAYKCFYQMLSKILPSKNIKILFQNFINMTNDVKSTLLENNQLSSFFKVNSDIHKQIKDRPEKYFDWSLQDSNSLFIWTYLLHCYIDLKLNKQLQSYNNLLTQYAKDNISKETWAHPTWYIIHLSAYYAPVNNKDWNQSFKAFISCLRYALPCPKCRAHLHDNLQNIDYDSFANTNTLFEFTVDLHNIVNQSLGMPIVTVSDAKQIYAPIEGPWIKQNVNNSRFW